MEIIIQCLLHEQSNYDIVSTSHLLNKGVQICEGTTFSDLADFGKHSPPKKQLVLYRSKDSFHFIPLKLTTLNSTTNLVNGMMQIWEIKQVCPLAVF